MLAAAFPKVGISSLAWIAPALLVLAAAGCTGGEAFRIGYIAGFAQWLASLYWLLFIPVAWYPILGWIVLSVYLALYPAVWVWLVLRISRFTFHVSSPEPRRKSPLGFAGEIVWGSWTRRTLWALVGAAIWVALEMVRARLLSGFPWIPLGASQYEMLPLIQIASVTGVYGVSFVVVWCSLSLLLAGIAILRHPATRSVWVSEIILPVLALVVLLMWGNRPLAQSPPPTRELEVAFVQPSIPQTMIWNPRENATRFNRVMEVSETVLAAKPASPESIRGKLLIWPEAALPDFNEPSYTAITNMIRTHRIWMIFGADEVERRLDAKGSDEYEYFNSAFLFNPEGQYVASYRKRHLVMFGEYIPWSRWLPFLRHFTPIQGGFTPGKKPVAFVLDDLGVVTSTLICFEDIFPDLARDSVEDDTDFLLNLTNNGWFRESAAQWQHGATAIFRAVENGLPLLRCSNNGLTCWVDAHGRIREVFRDDAGTIYGPGVMTARIPLLEPGQVRPPTFYRRHGDWFGWGCVGIALVSLAAKGRGRPETARPTTKSQKECSIN